MDGYRIGKIFGLEIRIDPSWLVIFFLVLWSFTAGVFPQRHPGLPGGVYFGMGLTGTLLFFVSVLLHEMAHSVVALRRGVRVEGITLFIFGGIAHARSEFENAGDEFVIAAAGPLSSFLIAAALAAAAAGGRALDWSVAVTGVLSYLALLNFILAVFNLAPGFPLDGGRLLRAAVWKVSGDMTKATRIAATGGKVLGYLLMGLGVVQVFGGALIGGLWMMLIGWFVRMAAGSGYAQHLLRNALAGLAVEDMLSGPPQVTGPDVAIADFLAEYRFRGLAAVYPVVDATGAPIGTITLQKAASVPAAERPNTPVARIMNPLDRDMLVDASEGVLELLDRAQQGGMKPVVVVTGDRLSGVVTTGDIRRWLERAGMG